MEELQQLKLYRKFAEAYQIDEDQVLRQLKTRIHQIEYLLEKEPETMTTISFGFGSQLLATSNSRGNNGNRYVTPQQFLKQYTEYGEKSKKKENTYRQIPKSEP